VPFGAVVVAGLDVLVDDAVDVGLVVVVEVVVDGEVVAVGGGAFSWRISFTSLSMLSKSDWYAPRSPAFKSAWDFWYSCCAAARSARTVGDRLPVAPGSVDTGARNTEESAWESVGAIAAPFP
jgi:hypothetical protein